MFETKDNEHLSVQEIRMANFFIIIIVRSRAVSNCLNPPVIWLLVFNFDPLLCTK